MKRLTAIILASALLGLTGTMPGVSASEPESANSPGDSEACADSSGCKVLPHKVIAYYFHGEARCSSCRRIEAWSAEAITGTFQKELNEGRLEWKVVNVDEAANEHFNDDYKLYTKSVVIVEMRDGKQTRWKNLERVWNYLSDQSEFTKYVSYEVGDYLKEG